MKRNRKPLLKWRRVDGAWCAGPFNIVDRIGVLHNYCVTYLYVADQRRLGEAALEKLRTLLALKDPTC